MIPGKVKVQIKQGDTFRLYFRVRETLPNGSAGPYVDLTGKFPKAQLRDLNGGLLANFVCTLADQTDDDTKGGVEIRLGPVTTGALTGTTNKKPNAKYDVQISDDDPDLVDDDSEVDTYLEGDVTIYSDVTELTDD